MSDTILSPTEIIHQYLQKMGLPPTAENVTRALAANTQNPGTLPGLLADPAGNVNSVESSAPQSTRSPSTGPRARNQSLPIPPEYVPPPGDTMATTSPTEGDSITTPTTAQMPDGSSGSDSSASDAMLAAAGILVTQALKNRQSIGNAAGVVGSSIKDVIMRAIAGENTPAGGSTPSGHVWDGESDPYAPMRTKQSPNAEVMPPRNSSAPYAETFDNPTTSTAQTPPTKAPTPSPYAEVWTDTDPVARGTVETSSNWKGESQPNAPMEQGGRGGPVVNDTVRNSTVGRRMNVPGSANGEIERILMAILKGLRR